jgi:hypothetical protein
MDLSDLPLAGLFAMELGLEWEYEIVSRRVLFSHRRHGIVYSCDRYVAMHPGEWMAELRAAVDLLDTFDTPS